MAWIATNSHLPEQGQRIEWLHPGGGNPIQGTYYGRWVMDCGMYVYYCPPFWRAL